MKNFLLVFLKYLRKYFVIIFTVVSYLCFLYYFLFFTRWLMCSVFLLLFFIFIHYFFIELKSYGLLYLILVVGVSVIFEVFVIGFCNLWEILSVCAINLGIIFLFFHLDGEINNRKIISAWSIFTGGVGIFSLFVALSYAFMVISKYSSFNLTCDDLYQGTNKLIDIISNPLKLSVEEVKRIKEKIAEFKDKKVKDVMVGSGDFSELIVTGDVIKMSHAGILGWIDRWKVKLVDSVLKDKKSVDKGICNFMIIQIKERYNKPSFRMSVVLLLTLFLWQFLRFILFIIGILNFVTFEVLKFFKVYRFILKTDEVEEII